MGGGGPQIFFMGILIFLLFRSPRKILEPYNSPFWDFSNGDDKKKNGIIPRIVAYLSLLRWSNALRSDQKSKHGCERRAVCDCLNTENPHISNKYHIIKYFLVYHCSPNNPTKPSHSRIRKDNVQLYLNMLAYQVTFSNQGSLLSWIILIFAPKNKS